MAVFQNSLSSPSICLGNSGQDGPTLMILGPIAVMIIRTTIMCMTHPATIPTRIIAARMGIAHHHLAVAMGPPAKMRILSMGPRATMLKEVVGL